MEVRAEADEGGGLSAPVPIRHLARRMPRHGKIKIGELVKARSGKTMPAAIEVFRFTSNDRGAIEAIAERYGGTPKVWAGGPNGHWEVKTDAREIPIALPPDPLGGTPLYELWSGKGSERRCDGEVCEVLRSGPEGPEVVEVACICAQRNRLECKVKTRLTVILREIAFGGGWLLETGGKNAAEELPGMVEAVQAVQARGFVSAVLALEKRTTKQEVEGKPIVHHFVVPVVRPAVTLEALAAGGGRVGLGSPASPEALPPPSTEDEVVEAEVALRMECNLCHESVEGWSREDLLANAREHMRENHA